MHHTAALSPLFYTLLEKLDRLLASAADPKVLSQLTLALSRLTTTALRLDKADPQDDEPASVGSILPAQSPSSTSESPHLRVESSSNTGPNLPNTGPDLPARLRPLPLNAAPDKLRSPSVQAQPGASPTVAASQLCSSPGGRPEPSGS